MAVWVIYGTAKAGLFMKRPPPPANESADDFELEIGARDGLLEVWGGGADRPPNAELDQEVMVRRAGFLPELVVLLYARAGWTIPGNTVSALRLEEFATRFSGDYTPVTLARIKPPSGKLTPDIPGRDFPDPQLLPISPATCGIALEQRRTAWERWAILQPRLGGIPVAASSQQQFARQLVAVKSDAARAGSAVTWVSERVAHLAWLDGFCAVEAKDWPRALSALTRAAFLDPSNPAMRLELSLALTMLGRLKEGLQEVDRVLASTEDGCQAASAWRRRGYILIDLDALEAARRAYETSLKLEPGNPIALRELSTIATALKQHKAVRDIPEVTADPAKSMVVTRCPSVPPPERTAPGAR